MDDTSIIDLYWARDPEAIRETDRSYGRRLFALARGILGSSEDAEETVSDTYFKTWQTLPPQRPVFFFAYLSQLCRRAAFGRLDWKNAAKRKAEVVALTEEMERCIPDRRREDPWEAETVGRVLNRFLEDLTPENRLLFLRRYWHCESIAQIAQRCQFTEGKVKTRLHRLRKQLREALEQEGIWL